MKKQTLTTLAIGSVFAAAALSPVTHAADNPFATKQLSAGYQLAQADTKSQEGKCGAEKKAADKKTDGKCGEAKCGADKKPADKKQDEKTSEGKCGAKK